MNSHWLTSVVVSLLISAVLLVDMLILLSRSRRRRKERRQLIERLNRASYYQDYYDVAKVMWESGSPKNGDDCLPISFIDLARDAGLSYEEAGDRSLLRGLHGTAFILVDREAPREYEGEIDLGDDGYIIRVPCIPAGESDAALDKLAVLVDRLASVLNDNGGTLSFDAADVQNEIAFLQDKSLVLQ